MLISLTFSIFIFVCYTDICFFPLCACFGFICSFFQFIEVEAQIKEETDFFSFLIQAFSAINFPFNCLSTLQWHSMNFYIYIYILFFHFHSVQSTSQGDSQVLRRFFIPACHLESLQAISQDNYRAHGLLFTPLSGSLSHAACFPMSGNHCLVHIFFFLVVYGGRINFVHVTLS